MPVQMIFGSHYKTRYAASRLPASHDGGDRGRGNARLTAKQVRSMVLREEKDSCQN